MRNRPASYACILAAAAGACSYLTLSRGSWEPPRVVTVVSKEELGTLLPSWGAWKSAAEDGITQALLLRDGDHVVGADVPVPYRATDGPSLTLTREPGTTGLGGTTVGVSLGEAGGCTWVNQASERQLARVRSVHLPATLDAEAVSALERLAAANPDVDLLVESDDGLARALPLLRPRAVFVGESVDPAALAPLAEQPQLETLSIAARRPGSLDVLASLPGLRHLIIGNWDVERAGPLPAGLSGLRTLVVAESKMQDLSALRAAPAGLQELSLVLLQQLDDVSGLGGMTGLRTLLLWGDDKLTDLSGLNALKELRWIGLPPKTTQEQFAAVVRAHPDLAVLEMPACENVTDLSPLRELTDLQCLVVGGPQKNLDVLAGMTSLRFVGVAAKFYDASPGQVAALRDALPDAVVVRVKPFCLGSGWILLLVPAVALAWILRGRPRRTGLAG